MSFPYAPVNFGSYIIWTDFIQFYTKNYKFNFEQNKKMKLSLVLPCLSLVAGDLIGFNRYRNNAAKHAQKRSLGTKNTNHFLQIIVRTLQKGDVQTAKRMIQMLEDRKDSTNDVQNWQHRYRF